MNNSKMKETLFKVQSASNTLYNYTGYGHCLIWGIKWWFFFCGKMVRSTNKMFKNLSFFSFNFHIEFPIFFSILNWITQEYSLFHLNHLLMIFYSFELLYKSKHYHSNKISMNYSILIIHSNPDFPSLSSTSYSLDVQPATHKPHPA